MSSTNTFELGDIVKVKDTNDTGKIIKIESNKIEVELYLKGKPRVFVTPENLLKKVAPKKVVNEPTPTGSAALSRQRRPTDLAASFGSAASFGQHSPTGSAALSRQRRPTDLAASFGQHSPTGLAALSIQHRPTDLAASFAELTPRHQEIRSYLEGEVRRFLIPALGIMRRHKHMKGKPTKFSKEQVITRSREITSLNFTLLREDFRRCTQLMDFLNVSQEDILAIKSQLDFVESTAFLLHNDDDLNFTMELAFNVRNDYYHEHFVAPGAKHEGNHQNTENYLRLITMNNSLKEIQEKASIFEREMLSQVGLVKAGGKSKNSYIVKGKKMTQANHNQMEILVKQYYRALLGIIIMSDARNLIGTIISHPHGKHDEIAPVTVTQDLIESIPITIRALRNARKLESEALLSCIGFEQSNKITEPHNRELRIVEMLADIDFDTNPNQIIDNIGALIAMELEDHHQIKYLKYKIKYLNLKKQLNL